MKLKYTIAALAATTLGASAAQYITSYSTVTGADDNNQAGPNFGQSITVNVGADTADASIASTVYIEELSFQYSSSASGGAPDGVYIHVYDAFAVDGSAVPTTIGNLVAVSSTTVDMSALVGNEQLTWTFDGTDAIAKGTEYTYVLATDTVAATVGNSANLSSAGFELDTGNPYSGGRTYRANGTQSDWDMPFELKTNDTIAVPEPSSTALLGLGGLALILRRRK